jgi:hypothetical protein
MFAAFLRQLNKQTSVVRNASTFYVQGQTPSDQSNVREYFYYIDSFGQVRRSLPSTYVYGLILLLFYLLSSCFSMIHHLKTLHRATKVTIYRQ